MPKGEDSTANFAWDLGSRISEVVGDGVKRGLLSKKWQLFRKLTIDDFRYGPSGSGYKTKQSTATRQVWDPFEIHDFFVSHIEHLPEMKKLANSISERYDLQPVQAEYNTKALAMAIIGGTLEGMNRKWLNDLIVTFANDLAGSPKKWHVESHIEGIWLEPDKVELSDGTLLRKPTPEDFEREVLADIADIALPFETSCVPGAILECDFLATSDLQRDVRAEQEILALRLFDVGSVHSLITHYTPTSLFAFSFSASTQRGFAPSNQYIIDSERVPSLQDFVKGVRRIIPAGRFLLDFGPKDHMTVAIQRYSEALLKPDPPESRLTLAIMGLEALYLKSRERSELSLRLSQRVGKCLACFGFEPLRVFNDVMRSYEIRSTYVHGGFLENDKRSSVEKNLRRILNYLRVSIVIFLQMQNEEGKDAFIALLQHSMLEEKAQEKLNARLGNLEIQPPIHPQ